MAAGDAPDICVALGDLRLANPFIVGAGPTVKKVDHIIAAEQHGWAAASFKLAIDPSPYINLPPRYRWLRRERMHIFTAETRLDTEQSLRLLEEARRRTSSIVLIPTFSYNGRGTDGWVRLGRRFADAGAHALELNLCCPNMSFNVELSGNESGGHTGASQGASAEEVERIVGSLRDAVDLPIVVKLTPEGGRIAWVAAAALRAGANAVGSTANRLGIPDFDIRNPHQGIYRLQDSITLGCISGPWLRPLALRDTYEIRSRVGPGPCVLGSGGVSDLQSAVQQIMAGASAVWVCTQTMLRGFDWLEGVLRELREYMRDMGFASLRDFQGALLPTIKTAGELVVHEGHAVVDPVACTACGRCWSIGHCPAISHPDDRTTIDAKSCLGCSTCVDLCPVSAIQMKQTSGGRQ